MRGNVKRVLVAHWEGLGDSILSMPFLSALTRLFVRHEICLLTGTGRRDLFFGWDRPRVIELHELDAVSEVGSSAYDLVFDLSTGWDHLTDRPLFSELKYNTYVGFRKPRTIRGEITASRGNGIPRWRHFLSLLASFCQEVPSQFTFSFPVSDLNRRFAEMLLPSDPDRPLIALAPGAVSDERKKWPAASFATVMKDLHARSLGRFVILGSLEDASLAQEIVQRLDFRVDDLTGLTTLGAVVHILKATRLLIANDNGIMHLGGILDTPTLGLFGPTHPGTFHPLGRRSSVLQSPSERMEDLAPGLVIGACASRLASP